MKRIAKDSHMRVELTKNMFNEAIIDISLFGSTTTCINTKKEAEQFLAFLTELKTNIRVWKKNLDK